MRVNIYAEEMTDRIEIISKTIEGQEFTGLRLYLELPVTIGRHREDRERLKPSDPISTTREHRSVEGPQVNPPTSGEVAQVAGPFMHGPGDDDSAAVTFWGKRDLRAMLHAMLAALDDHYSAAHAEKVRKGTDSAE